MSYEYVSSIQAGIAFVKNGPVDEPVPVGRVVGVEEASVTVTAHDGPPPIRYPSILCTHCLADTSAAVAYSTQTSGTFCSQRCADQRAAFLADIAQRVARPPWLSRGPLTYSGWRDLIAEHAPACVTVDEIISKLAERAGVVITCPQRETSRIMLARSLFRTDPEVVAFVERVGDRTIRKHVTKWNAVTMRADIVESINETKPDEGHAFTSEMQTAWDRDENGWRTRAMDRAVVMAEWLGAVLR